MPCLVQGLSLLRVCALCGVWGVRKASTMAEEEFVYNDRYHAWLPASAEPDEWARENLGAPPPRTEESAVAPESAPCVDRHISGRELVEREAFECPICCEFLVDPVTTECGHTFCRHCISTCFGQVVRSFAPHEAPRVKCPRCRTPIAIHYDINAELVATMRTRGILRAQQSGACRGVSATINCFDGNRTESEVFELLFLRAADTSLAGTLEADIVWGGGSVHSTYRETTSRVEGTVDADGTVAARAVYSNGPWEEWSGRLVEQSRTDATEQPAAFKLVDGKYLWHGWNGRTTKGNLELAFTTIRA